MVQDAQGKSLSARAQVISSDGRPRPLDRDDEHLSHVAPLSYFYVDSAATVTVPVGVARVVVSRGFEFYPFLAYVDVGSDTAVTVVLERVTDLRPKGWYGGDLHAHSRHAPLDYDLSAARVRWVAEAEGLSVLHLLDQEWEFTGGPHALSDSVVTLYYSYEHRNQTFGHVDLPGLGSPVAEGCCLSPTEPAYPMLMDLAELVHQQPGARMVLAHPHSTNDYDLLSGWPGTGLGRELPVLAALGGLDAFDLASYSSDPDLDLEEWFDLLSAGFAIPPSAGTDAALNRFGDSPPGGWRVYGRVTPGAEFDYEAWLAALVAGRCFVTGYPLIPEFSVGGSGPGEAFEVAGDSLVAALHLETSCAIGLRAVTLVADGADVWSRLIPASPVAYAFDTTFVVRMARPGWLLLRVDGTPGHPAAAAQSVAYTNAVRVLHEGAPTRRPDAMAGWLQRVDALRDLLISECTWSQSWQRDTVLARIGRARQFYAAPFRNSPGDFALESPLPGDTAWAGLGWSEATDPDAGDLVTYTVRLGTDSTLSDATIKRTTETFLTDLSLVPCRWYWWSVEAEDRAGDVTVSTPRLGWFYQPGVLDVGDAPREGPLRAWPNPSRSAVALQGMGARVVVYDLAGRRVAWPGHGIGTGPGGAVWDGLDGGRPAAPGVYLARGAAAGHALRIVRLR